VTAIVSWISRRQPEGRTIEPEGYGFDHFKVETEREDDGRWLAEVLELPGVLAYGESEDAALSKVQALALRVIAERLEHGEAGPESSPSPSTLRDCVAEHPRASGAGRASSDWMDRSNVNPVRIALCRVTVGRFCIRVPRQ